MCRNVTTLPQQVYRGLYPQWESYWLHSHLMWYEERVLLLSCRFSFLPLFCFQIILSIFIWHNSSSTSFRKEPPDGSPWFTYVCTQKTMGLKVDQHNLDFNLFWKYSFKNHLGFKSSLIYFYPWCCRINLVSFLMTGFWIVTYLFMHIANCRFLNKQYNLISWN